MNRVAPGERRFGGARKDLNGAFKKAKQRAAEKSAERTPPDLDGKRPGRER